MRRLTVAVASPLAGPLLVPVGIASPHGMIRGLTVEGGRIATLVNEPELGLCAALVAHDGGPVTLEYRVEPAPDDTPYPEAVFRPRANRYTTAASALAEASRTIARAAGGGDAGIEALVAEAESRFAYDHPETRFNDGTDSVPHLSCGLTPGSCVDINTYLVASLRAAGFEAGYVYGYFFPAERGGRTDDGHCWVVTRHGGTVREWDIAHHLKAGLGPTRAAPNPLPGERVALTHSMGHSYALPDRALFLKILGEPLHLPPDGPPCWTTLDARLSPVDATP
ncbi:transglutaminase-like domain-containing protein [Meridianimarinicoccus sp. RP-17]|uniref:transglutaminase-like domain-containing protein n=1 Tax=Meridianimarinicoccus zhengii TaxID=2056810 RepID=UPI000DADA1A4|nr:transglutaminase domain-containing protein [Phycocomes zhengii]